MSKNEHFVPLSICVLTVSDTRNEESDSSGKKLIELLSESGHVLHEKVLIKDDIYQIRAHVSRWIADPKAQVVLITGGTGFAGRDSTPEAVRPLFDKEVIGFGELFRSISHGEIGSSTIQSRTTAGLANRTLVFCLPGSTGACVTAWTNIIAEQLDARHAPCNFVAQVSEKAVLN